MSGSGEISNFHEFKRQTGFFSCINNPSRGWETNWCPCPGSFTRRGSPKEQNVEVEKMPRVLGFFFWKMITSLKSSTNRLSQKTCSINHSWPVFKIWDVPEVMSIIVSGQISTIDLNFELFQSSPSRFNDLYDCKYLLPIFSNTTRKKQQRYFTWIVNNYKAHLSDEEKILKCKD